MILALLMACAYCFADSVPSWVIKPEKDFPSRQYIRSIGEANTVKAAKAAALAEISLFFEAKTEVVTQAVKKSCEIIEGDKQFFASSKSFGQLVNIKSNADFFCVNFTDSYYDVKHDKHTVLAYIDKNEAAEIYRTRIAALLESVDSLMAYAKKESEPFLAGSALTKAKTLSALAEQYIKAETVIVPADSAIYKEPLKNLSKVDVELSSIKKLLTFTIKMTKNDPKLNPLFSTVSSLIVKRGFAYSLADAKYAVVIDVAFVEEEYESGPYVRPSGNFLIVNAAGKGVYTYSKAYPRSGSKTMDLAYTRAVSKIKQDLEENFLAEF